MLDGNGSEPLEEFLAGWRERGALDAAVACVAPAVDESSGFERVEVMLLAAHAKRVRLGTMVTAATFRPPSVLIKAVTTLDVLSGGRAWLGVGAGYHEEEARAMGLPLPPVGERFERLEEILKLALQMWAGDSSSFEGRDYRLEKPVGNPLPLSRPHPPILVGGMGERKTLRLVAAYADACNLFDIPDGGKTISHKLAVLARHCDAGQQAARTPSAER